MRGVPSRWGRRPEVVREAATDLLRATSATGGGVAEAIAALRARSRHRLANESLAALVTLGNSGAGEGRHLRLQGHGRAQ